MAEALILKFTGVTESDYQAVNDKLGIDMASGVDIPAGLLTHAAGMSDDGSLVVAEVWESRDAQGQFMATRLGAALGDAGVTTMPKVTWVSLFASFTFGN